jgi:hypothetical protein
MKKQLLYNWDVLSLGMQARGTFAQGYKEGADRLDLDGKLVGVGRRGGENHDRGFRIPCPCLGRAAWMKCIEQV